MKNITSFFAVLLLISCSTDSNETNLEPISQYTLTTQVNPINTGTVSPSTGTYSDGASVLLTATANADYTFKEWNGGVTGTTNPISVTINANISITAFFELIDTDGDTVTDSLDNCPNTPIGESVDTSGCSNSQDTSLLGLYFLDGNANDSSGYQNNSSFVGNVSPTQNRNGESEAAMIFEANDSYLEVADSNLLSPDSSISISVWVYSYNPLANTFQAIVNKIEHISGTNSFQGYYLGINSSNGRLRWNVTNNIIETTTVFPTNQWVHIVAIYSNGVQKLFIDNTLIAENSIGNQPLNNNVNFRIGAQSQFADVTDFIGAIDDVYIYERELTEAEIANLYNN